MKSELTKIIDSDTGIESYSAFLISKGWIHHPDDIGSEIIWDAKITAPTDSEIEEMKKRNAESLRVNEDLFYIAFFGEQQ